EIHSDEPFHALHDLLRAWCDRRCLEALNLILPAHLAFNGLTAAWRRLYDALSNLRASARHELTDEEAEKVDMLIGLARRIIWREVSLRAHPKDAEHPRWRPVVFIRVPKRAAIQSTAIAIVGSAPSSAGNCPGPQFCAGSNACNFRHGE